MAGTDRIVREVSLRVPLAADVEYRGPQHVAVNLAFKGGPAVSRTVARLRDALHLQHVLLDDGSHVESYADALRWVLQEIERLGRETGEPENVETPKRRNTETHGCGD